MLVVDIKELSARNRALRVKRLELLRKSVAGRCYQINPAQIAGGMIREACLDAASRRAEKAR